MCGALVSVCNISNLYIANSEAGVACTERRFNTNETKGPLPTHLAAQVADEARDGLGLRGGHVLIIPVWVEVKWFYCMYTVGVRIRVHGEGADKAGRGA